MPLLRLDAPVKSFLRRRRKTIHLPLPPCRTRALSETLRAFQSSKFRWSGHRSPSELPLPRASPQHPQPPLHPPDDRRGDRYRVRPLPPPPPRRNVSTRRRRLFHRRTDRAPPPPPRSPPHRRRRRRPARPQRALSAVRSPPHT